MTKKVTNIITVLSGGHWELWINPHSWALPLEIYADFEGYKAITFHFLCFVLAFDW